MIRQTVTALVPMRHDSQRVPGKNYRCFAGRPLYHHVITTLLACPLVTRVAIDTDSPYIWDDAVKHFPQVCLIERPPHLRGDDTSMNEVLLYDITRLPSDWYLQTHSTNPLLKAETITEALNRFFSAVPTYDSLFSVTRVQSRFWDAEGQPINHDPKLLLRTQDLPPIFEENSNMYLFSGSGLKRWRNRIGERPLMFEMERLEAVDIDEESDFQFAEFLCREHEKGAP